MSEWYESLLKDGGKLLRMGGSALQTVLPGIMGTSGPGKAMEALWQAGASPGVANAGGGAAPWLGPLGNLVGGVGDLMTGDAGGYGRLVNAATGTISAVPQLASGLGSALGVADIGPALGTVGGLANMATNGYEAYEHRDEIDGGYTNNRFWTNTGEATMGAANAAASWFPPAQLYVKGTELALDGVGMAAGLVGDGIDWLGDATGAWETDNDWRFSAGSVVGGIEHALYDGWGNANDSVGGGIGAGIGTALGVIGGPLGMVAGGALGATVGDWLSENGGGMVDSVGETLGDIGGGISDAASAVLSW